MLHIQVDGNEVIFSHLKPSVHSLECILSEYDETFTEGAVNVCPFSSDTKPTTLVCLSFILLPIKITRLSQICNFFIVYVISLGITLKDQSQKYNQMFAEKTNIVGPLETDYKTKVNDTCKDGSDHW